MLDRAYTLKESLKTSLEDVSTFLVKHIVVVRAPNKDAKILVDSRKGCYMRSSGHIHIR